MRKKGMSWQGKVDFLKEQGQARGETQDVTARAIGCSQSAFNFWTNRKHKPRSSNKALINDAYLKERKAYINNLGVFTGMALKKPTVKAKKEVVTVNAGGAEVEISIKITPKQ